MLSKSRILQYQRCPRQYKYQHIDKLPLPDPKEDSPLEVGLNVHQIFEDVLNNSITNNIDEMINYMMSHSKFKSIYLHHIENFAKFINNCQRSEYKIVGIEDYLSNDIIQLHGYLDLVLEKDGKLTIIDYKTGATKPITQFRLELIYYGYLAENFYKKPIDEVGIFFSKSGVLRVAKYNNVTDKGAYLTKGDIDAALQYLFEVRELIENEVFPYKKSWLCKFCDFKLRCEKDGYHE